MSHDLRAFTLGVSRAAGIGPHSFTQLCAELNGIENVYTAFQTNALPPKFQSVIAKAIHQDWSAQLTKFGLNYVCVWEQAYPSILRQIADPPPVLFYKGSWQPEIFAKTISVVGTRAATSQGKLWTQSLVTELVAAGFTIVSGMAFGIDAAVHSSALKAEGHTIAVLAGSANQPSPIRNKYIYDAILTNGDVVLSECFPGDDLVAGMFASRNRIVAGLSQATLVIEADIKSGALITADLALGYGRQVFAVPGEPNRQMSRGCNHLIKHSKASLIESANDILVELGLVSSTDQVQPQALAVKDKLENIGPSARIIYAQLQIQPQHLEQICAQSGQNTSQVLPILTNLQMQGLVIQTEIGEYEAI